MKTGLAATGGFRPRLCKNVEARRGSGTLPADACGAAIQGTLRAVPRQALRQPHQLNIALRFALDPTDRLDAVEGP